MSLWIRLAFPVIVVMWLYEKIPLSTVVLAWPLIEILARLDVIAKKRFGVDIENDTE